METHGRDDSLPGERLQSSYGLGHFVKALTSTRFTLGTQFHMIYGRVILYPNHISFQDTLHFNASVML